MHVADRQEVSIKEAWMSPEGQRVAVIAIIAEDSSCSEKINELLHEAGEYIIGRTGIPYREKNINIITIAIDAPQDVINSLGGKIGRLQGVSVKIAYSNVIS